MKIALGFTLLLLLLSSTQAELYKSVDADGNVVYSDEETPGAEEIIPDALITVPMSKYKPKESVEKEAPTQTQYTRFKITSPANDATVRDSTGAVQIALFSKPKLDIKAGHSITVFVDGKQVAKNSKTMSIRISDIYRGSHQVHATIRDKNNKTLITSNSVRFHLKRQSILNKSGAVDPNAPIAADGSRITPGPQGVYFRPGPVPVAEPAS